MGKSLKINRCNIKERAEDTIGFGMLRKRRDRSLQAVLLNHPSINRQYLP
jgi:hypothetical protein